VIRENLVKQRLQNGENVIGSFIKTTDPAIMEAIALAGFDFALIDNEHTGMNVETLTNLLRAAEIYNLVTAVRVKTLSAMEILQVLDAGTLGVLAPQTNTAQDARLLAQSARFAPEGRRGFAHATRAAAYGTLNPIEYARMANERTLVMCYCESAAALENLDEILAVPGIDMIFVGPFDLSQALGVIGQIEHPLVLAAYETIIRKSRAAGKAVGTIAGSAAQARRWMEQGIQFIVLSSDLGLIVSAGKSMLKELR
jgi:4-hydroxy-2-oxoheptanedioate aldolase